MTTYDALEAELNSVQDELQDALDNPPDAVEVVARAEAEHKAAAAAAESDVSPTGDTDEQTDVSAIAHTDQQIAAELDAIADSDDDAEPSPPDPKAVAIEHLRRIMPTDAELEADALDRLPSDEPAQLQRSRLQREDAARKEAALATATAWLARKTPPVPDNVTFAVDDIEDEADRANDEDDGY